MAGIAWKTAEELAGMLDDQAFPPVNLAEGICVYQIRARVRGLLAAQA